jgi:hypothetical protein
MYISYNVQSLINIMLMLQTLLLSDLDVLSDTKYYLSVIQIL